MTMSDQALPHSDIHTTRVPSDSIKFGCGHVCVCLILVASVTGSQQRNVSYRECGLIEQSSHVSVD